MSKIHQVEPGDSVASLADVTGHAPETIWNHPENDVLRSRRGNMNILGDDDELFIPDIRNKAVPCATGKRHRFRRVGVPALYRLQLLLDGQPRKNLRYLLVFEGRVIDDFTDDRGVIEVFVPPSIREMQLFIDDEEIPRVLKVGELEPSDSITGMQQRLRNLGYDCAASGSMDEPTRTALRTFQQRAEIDPTGEPDPDTLAALGRAHDEIGGQI